MAVEVDQSWTKPAFAHTRNRKRRKRFGIAQVVMLLLLLSGSIAVGYLGYQRFSPPKVVVESVTTTTAGRGSITATINMAGSVAAKSQAKLAFESPGLLSALSVKLGDSVKGGHVLAKLDTADLTLQLAQAEVTVEQARVKLAQLKEGPKQVEVAAAQASFDSAMTKYQDLKAGPKPEDVAAAETAVRNAEVDLANARNALVVSQKSATVSKNVRDRENEHNYYEAKVGDTVAKMQRGEASQADLDRDYSNLLTAKEKLDSARAEAEMALRRAESDVSKAENALAKAKDNVQQLASGATPDQLKSAEAVMLNAKSQLDAKMAGTSTTDISAQEVAVRLAEATLKQKQLLLQKAALMAPFDGIVDAISATAGEQVAASKEVLTLVNMKQFQITARVDETQVGRLTVGQTAAVTLDALPEARLTATVSSIGANAVVSQGVVNYPVVLDLRASDSPVRPGMTANAVVEVARRDNVVLVPNRSIRTQGRNRTVVVTANGASETRVVTAGMSNDQFTEVTSGLQEGETVVIPATTTAAPRVPQGGLGGMPVGAQGGLGGAPVGGFGR